MPLSPQQLKGLYFPAWNAAFKANWRVEKGMIYSWRVPMNGYATEIEAIARSIFKLGQGVEPEHLRKACHAAAIGRSCSSKLLTNPELDRVLVLFKLLEDPEDLDAIMRCQNPGEANPDRLINGIAKLMPEPYIVAVSKARFGTKNWRGLNTDQLRQLHFTVKARAKNNAARRQPVKAEEPY